MVTRMAGVSRSRATISACRATGPIGTHPIADARIQASAVSASPARFQPISQKAQSEASALTPAIGHTRRLPGSRVQTAMAVAAVSVHARIGTTT